MGSRFSRSLVSLLAALPFGAWSWSASAQDVTGIVYEDVNRNGVPDYGEPRLSGLPVTIYGNDGTVDTTVQTAVDGSYLFTVTTGEKYVLAIDPGADWRFSFQDIGADASPIPDWPQGRKRPSVLDGLVGHLRASTPTTPLLHVALGDSIAWGFNLCGSAGAQDNYVGPFTVRLDDVGSATLSKLAELGYESRDLLDPGASGSIFDAIAAAPQLVTISIGGNDFRRDDGNTAKTAANVVELRQNLQEILSTLATELPDTDVVLNTVYDNESGNDPFHNTWAPIVNQMLRDVAWGQRRRVALAEIWPDYEHLDPATGTKLGEPNLICQFLSFDGIHPTKKGYDLHEEKLWQGVGGVNVGTGSHERNFGFLEKIETRYPTATFDAVGGASNDDEVLAEDDVGALVPGGNQELHALGFDATPRGLLSQVVVHVRYRTSAPPADDVYRFEASVDGTFSKPGSDEFSWNRLVPIVGGAGLGAPVLASPDEPVWRDVSATLTQGSAIDGSPTITWQDLATLAVRCTGAATGSADAFDVEWDVASIDLYGIPPYRLLLRGSPKIGETLQFDATGPENADDWIFVSPGTGNFKFGAWGTLLIDVTNFLLLNGGKVGPNGASSFSVDLPNDPSLVGVTAYVQALIIESYKPKQGALTNLASVTFE